MLDKYKYKIFESRIPGNIHEPKIIVLCNTVPEISKSNVVNFLWRPFLILQKNGGRIKISGCFHTNSEKRMV